MIRRTTKRPSMGDKIAELEARLAREVEERREYALRVHELENLPEIADRDKFKRMSEIFKHTLALLGLSVHAERSIVPTLQRIRKALDMPDDGHLETAVNSLKEIEKQAERSDAECDAGHERECKLEAALDLVREDRAALLKRLKLTERDWYMQGGAHPAHLGDK